MILSTTKPEDNGNKLDSRLSYNSSLLEYIFKYLTKNKIEEKLLIFYESKKNLENQKTNNWCSWFKCYSGEDGLIGIEEKNLIKPIIDNFNKKGIQVLGH